MPSRKSIVSTIAASIVLLSAATAFSQIEGLPGFTPPGGLGGLPGIGGGGKTKVSAEFEAEKGTNKGRLSVTAKLPPGWHIYSMTQPKGATGFPTRIALVGEAPLELAGAFQPDRDPKLEKHEGYTADSEEFEGTVTWTAPVTFKDGVDPSTLTFQVEFHGLVCDQSCLPVDEENLPVQFAGFYEPPAPPSGEYRDDLSHVTLRGHIEPQVVAPGDTARLLITAVPDAGYHIYKLEASDPKLGNKPTLIVLKKLAGLAANQPQASSTPDQKKTDVEEQPVLYFHKEPVTWTMELTVPPDAKPGDHLLAGAIAYQLCLDKACSPPAAAEFEVTMPVASERVEGQLPVSFTEGSYTSVAELAAANAEKTAKAKKKQVEPVSAATLGLYVLFGLIGGFILNLMPCVLPVVGLKVLSFAEQGGQERMKVFGLNLTYALGIFAVFMILATVAAFLNLGWGEQFTLTWFKVAMVGLVFVMALSFLGVWEIPIPGFSGSSQVGKLQSREGVAGAFFKGVFTTILATPCSGPFLGPVFGFTLSQPMYVTYVLFASVGIGMASPYLALGLAPGLFRLMPKPGAWMDTFKQLLGFVLLATVVFLFSTISSEYYIPTLVMIVGLWFACWLIGQLPVTAEFGPKVRRWAVAAAIAGAVTMAGFKMLGPSPHELPWQPYTPVALEKARSEGKTVLVDFSAEWCLTCKWNLYNSINTPRVYEMVEENDVVPLLADWTDRNDQIKQKLAELDSNSIPVFAVYPAGKPEDAVIVLRDLLTEEQVVQAIKQAGPSKTNASSETLTAMNE